MGKLRINELRVGMVLAEDVTTSGGRFLMPAGAKLDAGHLKSLAGWGVPEVAVQEPGAQGEAAGAPDASDIDPATREAAEAIVRRRFCRFDIEHLAGQLLFRLATDREAQKLATEGGDATALDPSAEAARFSGQEPQGKAPTPEAILREEPQLVSPPEVYLRISEVLRDPKSTVDDASEAIRHDPSLAAKLLRLVNSPFYTRTMRAVGGRFPSKVESLSRAVMVIGARQLSMLALGVSVLPLFQDIPQQWVNMRLFWEHSLGCAVTAQALAAATRQANPETAFVAGLMHDIARIILCKQAPRHMAAAMCRSFDEEAPLMTVEQTTLGFDHAGLGGLLLRKWKFPTNLEQMVCYHHDPKASENLAETALIHVADVLVNAMAWGSSGNRFVPPLCPEAWDALGLESSQLASLLGSIESYLGETMRNFFPDYTGAP